MLKKLFAPLSLALFVVGCASTPPSSTHTALVPSERVFTTDVLKSSSDKGQLTITRDTGFFYAGCSHDIYLNNVKTFNIKNGETITLNLPPREYLIRLEVATAICRKADVTTSDAVNLRVGDDKAYRIIVASSNTAQVRLVRMK